MVRLPTHEADLLIGCDAVVAANDMVLNLVNKRTSYAIINDNIDPVGVAGVGIGSIVDMRDVMSRLGAVMNRIKSQDLPFHHLPISCLAAVHPVP